MQIYKPIYLLATAMEHSNNVSGSTPIYTTWLLILFSLGTLLYHALEKLYHIPFPHSFLSYHSQHNLPLSLGTLCPMQICIKKYTWAKKTLKILQQDTPLS